MILFFMVFISFSIWCLFILFCYNLINKSWTFAGLKTVYRFNKVSHNFKCLRVWYCYTSLLIFTIIKAICILDCCFFCECIVYCLLFFVTVLVFFIVTDYNDLFVFCVDLNYFFMMEVINPWIVFVLLFWTFMPFHLFWREFILNAIYVNRFDATSNITLLHLFALVC